MIGSIVHHWAVPCSYTPIRRLGGEFGGQFKFLPLRE